MYSNGNNIAAAFPKTYVKEVDDSSQEAFQKSM